MLVLSTGVIGVPLPMGKLLPGLARGRAGAVSGDGGAGRGRGDHDHGHAARSRPSPTGAGFTVGGMAKGSGMIHPDLATMLAVVTTDYPLEPGEPIEFLRPAVDESFNAISVDGDCSTNDAVILLANGASGIERTPATDLAFAAALRKVCRDLAEQIVADGEGVTVLAEIAVTGAADDRQAKAIARRIATSALVKTALFGRDANWGRVLMAAGSAPYNGGYAEVDVDRMTLSYNGSVVLERGAPLGRRAGRLGRDLHDRARPRPRLRLGVVPDERPVLRLRPHQRGLPDVTRVVVKVGGAVASHGRRADHRPCNKLLRGRGRARGGAADLRRDAAARACRSSSSADGA